MNPLEDRIQKVPLIKPDAAWRDEILRSARDKSSQNWMSWAWPSPLAWAALVLIWLGLAVASRIESRRGRLANTAKPGRFYVLPDSKELRALLAQRR